MWGKFPVEDTCVFAKGSIPDLSSVERLSNGVQFVCLNKADGWSVTFFSEPNYKGTGWWVANCGRADLPWQPGSVKIERIDSNPPWVVPGLNLRPVYLPHISSQPSQRMEKVMSTARPPPQNHAPRPRSTTDPRVGTRAIPARLTAYPLLKREDADRRLKLGVPSFFLYSYEYTVHSFIEISCIIVTLLPVT